MEDNSTYNMPQEEEGLDIIGLVRQLWDGKKTIIICTAVFIVLGLVMALTMKRTYSVSSTMVPQMNSRTNSSLSSLASLAGIDMGMASAGSDLSPVIYPQIVSSVPFRLELMNTPLHYEKVDTMVSMFTYAQEYNKPGLGSYILKYTVGLPGTLLGLLRKEKEDPVFVDAAGLGESSPRPLKVSKDEEIMLKALSRDVSLSVDKKEGYLTLHVTGSEPLQTAELALKTQQMLQEEVTRFRTEKAQEQLDYVQARYNEIKAETESLQAQLATVRDRSQDMTTTRARIEQERLQTKYNVSSAIYSEMAKQLEQAKMQVKRDTPTLTVIQPVTVPRQPSNSRAKTLVVWTFLGFILGCGIVLARGYWPKVKEMFSSEDQKSIIE